MEIGISTFVETTPDVKTGEVISHAQRLREVVEEIVLADQVGLDVFGVGEHHRHDFAASSPAVVLAAAAAQTKRIRLTSAVTVLSSADPVRILPRLMASRMGARRSWQAVVLSSNHFRYLAMI
jgi:alkanesulfonate monooxygenase SsuD/methylene tetrahydromethanopterin reductase-like flavin-dependent oxidoreductase (luciferase family)